MAWFTRFTRFGDVHLCFGQEQNISCGLACIIMATFKINKLKPGTRAMYGEEDMMAKAIKLSGDKPLGDSGLTGSKMIDLLNDDSLAMQQWSLITPAIDDVNNQIIKHVGISEGFGPTMSVTPIIMLIQWKGGDSRHWVLIDTVRQFWGKLYATVCDPWDGSVHVIPLEEGKRFDYAAQQTIDFDFWGKRYRYGDSPDYASSRLKAEIVDDTGTASTWIGSIMLTRKAMYMPTEI